MFQILFNIYASSFCLTKLLFWLSFSVKLLPKDFEITLHSINPTAKITKTYVKFYLTLRKIAIQETNITIP
jgi:hypothetical protein